MSTYRKLFLSLAVMLGLLALGGALLAGQTVWEILFAEQFCSIRGRYNRVQTCLSWRTHSVDRLLALLGFGFLLLMALGTAAASLLAALFLRRAARAH